MSTYTAWAAAALIFATLSLGCSPSQPPGSDAPSVPSGAGTATPSEGVRINHIVKDNEGKDFDLSSLRGSVLLIVNTASQCGLTPQYEGLQSLYETYRARGFQVLAFPANDFRNQEPLSDAEIATFVKQTYGVSFPVFGKLAVVGGDKSPLWKDLTEATPAALKGDIKWNFTKFLVGRDGQVLARFEPRTDPLSPQVTEAIEKALSAPAP